MEKLFPDLVPGFQIYLKSLTSSESETYLKQLLSSQVKCHCSGCGMYGHRKNSKLCPYARIKIPICPLLTPTISSLPPFSPPATSPLSVKTHLPPLIPLIPPMSNVSSYPSSSSYDWRKDRESARIIQEKQDSLLVEKLTSDIESSILYPELVILARNDSWLDIMNRSTLYLRFYDYLQSLYRNQDPCLEWDDKILYRGLTNQHQQANFYQSTEKNVLTEKILETFALFSQKDNLPASSEDYLTTMKKLSFGEAHLNLDTHSFKSRLDAKPKRSQLIRVAKELATLSTSLPISDTTTAALRVSTHRTDFLSFLITGPMNTPYAYGCFIFDLYLPPDYPETGPQCWFRTTANNTVRFNPNLYQNGKVCLSLLGTWEGPGWNPKESSILQIINSLQSLVLVEEPYYNEPGYVKGPHSLPYSVEYNRRILRYTVQHAIIDPLSQILYGESDNIFDDVIVSHCRHHSQEIIKMARECDLEAEAISVLDLL